jgi:Transcription factor WhiB
MPGRRLTDGPPPWTKDAACTPHILSGRDPWHPDYELPRRFQAAMYEQARAVCISCPVQVECGRLGLELLNADSVDGMFGGMTPDELRGVARSVARSSRKVARHGTRARYVNYKCRCPPCEAANARYEADRRKRKAA